MVAVDLKEKRDFGSWWSPQLLLCSQSEMKSFLASVKTVVGHPDKMFGFGFNKPGEAIQTRGDQKRTYSDFSKDLFANKIGVLRDFLDNA